MGRLKIEKLEVYDNKGSLRSENKFGEFTVIYGPSNTGKSKMVKSIDYALGSRDKWPLDDEFERIQLTLSSNGHKYWLIRTNNDKKLHIFKDREFQDKYSTKELDEPFSGITGIKFGVDIPSNCDNEKKKYTWREMISFFLWKENISQRKSVFDSQYGSYVYRMAGINYLYNGDLFEDMILNEDVCQWDEMHDHYKRRLRIIEDNLKEIEAVLKDDTRSDMHLMLKRMNELLNEIADTDKLLMITKGRLKTANEESIELRMDLEKFETIRKQFITKIQRVELIVDGMINQDQLECTCPICKNVMNAPDMREYYDSIITDYKKNKMKILDLDGLISSTNSKLEIKEQEILELSTKIERLGDDVKKMGSELDTIRSMIKGDAERWVKLESKDALLEMREIYNRKMKEKRPEFRKFTEDRINSEIKKGILRELKRTLNLCFGYKNIELDPHWNPIIDGRTKDKEGDGNAGIINSLTLMAISKVLSDNDAGPGLLIVDSPCTAFKDLKDRNEVTRKFLEIAEEYSKDFQIILTDNNKELDDQLRNKMNEHLIEFTKDDNGRYGFLEGVRDRA